MPLLPPRLPSVSDVVIYGSLAASAAAVFSISFLGIVGTFYRRAWATHACALNAAVLERCRPFAATSCRSRAAATALQKAPLSHASRPRPSTLRAHPSACPRTTNPLVPPTRALGASLLLLSPLAAALIAGGVLADRYYLSIADTFSPGRYVGGGGGAPVAVHGESGGCRDTVAPASQNGARWQCRGRVAMAGEREQPQAGRTGQYIHFPTPGMLRAALPHRPVLTRRPMPRAL